MALVLKHNMPAIKLKLRMKESSRYRYPYIIRWGVFIRIRGSQSKCPFQSMSYICQESQQGTTNTTAYKQPTIWEEILFRDCSSCIMRLPPQDSRCPLQGQGLAQGRQAMLAGTDMIVEDDYYLGYARGYWHSYQPFNNMLSSYLTKTTN